ncbi:MAG: thioredoxin family protein [Pseudobdellovibrionaceae bacterium]
MPTYVEKLNLGMKAQAFELPGVEGKQFVFRPESMTTPYLIMFICNHCPYVKAIEDRLILLGQDLKLKNIPVFAICSNDPNDYPEDSFENMKARADLKKYSFHYLHDETQKVAKAYGAVCTPDFFLFNRKSELSYRGRLDDSWKDPLSVQKRELYEAAIELLTSDSVTSPQVPTMGCSIKWKKV